MNVKINKIGLSEDQLIELQKQGFGLSKKQQSLMLAAHNTPLPSNEEIEDFSKKFNIPIDYKKFLGDFNGGIPEENIIKTINNERVINCFLAMKAPRGFYDTVLNYYEIYKNRIPKNTLPIASAGSSDLILINLDDTENIYYWDHNFESDEDDAENCHDNLEKIADNFTDLLRKLYRPEL